MHNNRFYTIVVLQWADSSQSGRWMALQESRPLEVPLCNVLIPGVRIGFEEIPSPLGAKIHQKGPRCFFTPSGRSSKVITPHA